MTIEHTVTGMTLVSEFVTDGRDVWLHTERFIDYTDSEAVAIYTESVARNGWRVED